jgi:hypothetical protein
MSYLLFVWAAITIAGAVLLFIVSLQVHSKIILHDGINSSYVVFGLLKGIFNTRYSLSLKQGANNPIWLVKTDLSDHDRITVQEMINSLQSLIFFYSQNARIIRYLITKARLHRLSVLVRIGTGEAASTALTSAFVYNLLLYVNQYIRYKEPSSRITTEVVPVFKDFQFEFRADCIFSLKIGYIILTMIMIAIARLKGDEKRATAPN